MNILLSNAKDRCDCQDASSMSFALEFMGKQNSLVGGELLLHSVGSING